MSIYLRNYIKLLIITVLVVLLTPQYSYTQESPSFRKSSYVQNYRLDEIGYLVQCTQMSEDANGCIMTCSSAGLKLFNGRVWDRFLHTGKSDVISKVYVSPTHDIYVSGPDCIGYYHPELDGSMKYYQLEVPFNSISVSNIYGCDSDSAKVVFVLNDGLAILNNGIIIMRSMGEIAASTAYKGGIIILCKNGDLYSFFDGALQYVCNISDLNINTDGIKMLVINQSRMLFLCKGFSIFEFNIEQLLQRGTLSSTDIKKISLATDNHKNININDAKYNSRLRKIAIASNNGIYVYSDRYEYLQKIDRDVNLPLNEIVGLFFDSKNNLWASYSGGVSRIELNIPYVFYSASQGISGPVLSSFVDKNHYYVGTVSSIFVSSPEHSGRNTSFVSIPYDITHGQIFCWDIIGVEGCVIASTSEGLYQVFPDKAVQLASLGRVYGAAVSPKYPGKIFVTGFDGFQVCDYVVKNGKVSITKSWRYDQITRPLFKIIIADNGLLWATTLSDGIVRLTPKNDSLNDFDSEFIESNYGLERTSQLTVATVGNTLYVNDGQFKTAKLDNPTDSLVLEPDTLLNKIFSKDEIISHFVYCKYSDEFFVHTQQACWRINRSNPAINSVIHFRIPLSTVYNLNVVDSIVLFSTNFGLVKGDITDTTAYNPAQQPYNALINAIYFNDKSVFHGYRYFKPDASERNYNMFTTGTDPEHLTDSILDIKCDYADNKVRIVFSTSEFENPESVLYSIKIEGIDNRWSNWTHANVREFTKLPPGHYVFKVKSHNIENVESSVATFSFTIVPPFYTSVWAIILYILIGAFLVFLFIRRRTAKLKNKANDLSALLQQRNMQLEDQNERLRQMSFVATRSTNSVIIMDKDGNIQWTNDSFKNIYGCSFDEFLYIHGRNYFESYLSSDKKNQELIQLARQSNQNVTYETCHRFYGNVNWVQASLDTVFDDFGNLCNWILTETDITMLKRAQEEGARQASQLTEAFMQLQENQLQIEMQKEQLFLKNSELEKGYKKIEVQNNAITNSLQYAQQMQQSILPLEESITQYFDHFAIYMPKDIVSGDFYWFEPLPDGSLIYVVADCTGHGVPGAFMSLIGYNLLNEVIIMQGITQPKLIFENLSQGLINVLKQERNQNYDGMEVRLCRFVPFNGNYLVTFCGTGSSIFYYNCETDQMERIKGVHRHLGLTDETVVNNDFEEHQFVFHKGDKLFMITDGLVDQNNPQRKRFGTERFMKFVTEHRTEQVEVVGDKLKKLLNDFMDGQPQRDDITVVGLSIKQ